MINDDRPKQQNQPIGADGLEKMVDRANELSMKMGKVISDHFEGHEQGAEFNEAGLAITFLLRWHISVPGYVPTPVWEFLHDQVIAVHNELHARIEDAKKIEALAATGPVAVLVVEDKGDPDAPAPTLH